MVEEVGFVPPQLLEQKPRTSFYFDSLSSQVGNHSSRIEVDRGSEAVMAMPKW